MILSSSHSASYLVGMDFTFCHALRGCRAAYIQGELADREHRLEALQQRMQAELTEQQRRHAEEVAAAAQRHESQLAAELARQDKDWAQKAEAQVRPLPPALQVGPCRLPSV